MEDVVRFVNVHLIEFHALRHKRKHMESMVLNTESLGRNKVRYVHRGIRTVFSSFTRSKAFSGRYWYRAKSAASVPTKSSRAFCSQVGCARR